MKKLQNVTKNIVKVICLPSGNVKVYTKLKEVKEKLQKDSTWINAVATSAAIQQCTFAHGIRVQNINISNQARAIKYLQTSNGRLHLKTKIVRVLWPS